VPDQVETAQAYLSRAKALRAIAEGTTERVAREALFIVADERMAVEIEKKLLDALNGRRHRRWNGKSPPSPPKRALSLSAVSLNRRSISSSPTRARRLAPHPHSDSRPWVDSSPASSFQLIPQ
jgi:hypothetical protein